MNNQKQTLQQILEAMMTISTKGNDTITMSNCLQALNRVINEIQDEPVTDTAPVEPEVVE